MQIHTIITNTIRSITWTTSIPFRTLPKTECLLSNHGVATVVIKNCDPLVLGPAFAMERVNGLSCLKLHKNRKYGGTTEFPCNKSYSKKYGITLKIRIVSQDNTSRKYCKELSSSCYYKTRLNHTALKKLKNKKLSIEAKSNNPRALM